MVVLGASKPGGDRRYKASQCGEVERFMEAGAERCGNELREELPAREIRSLGCWHVGQRRPEKRLHGVVAEERSEKAAHRGQVGHPKGDARRDALSG